jgi:hypothetical protein
VWSFDLAVSLGFQKKLHNYLKINILAKKAKNTEGVTSQQPTPQNHQEKRVIARRHDEAICHLTHKPHRQKTSNRPIVSQYKSIQQKASQVK